MSEDNIESAIQAGQRIATVDSKIKLVEIDGKQIPVAIRETDTGFELHVLQDVLDAAAKRQSGPQRRQGDVVLTEVDSFIAYVKRFGTKDALVYADIGALGFTAILDENPPGSDVSKAAWRQHRARYTCPRSPEWVAWTKLDGAVMAQDKFADFIESRLEDLIVGDERASYPAPTDVLMMARRLMVKTKGTFERVINPTDGTGTLVSKTENEVESTKIHRAFLVGIPVFEGGQPYRVECRIRFTVAEGRPSFSYNMYRRVEIERDAFIGLRTLVGKDTGYPVLAGNP